LITAALTLGLSLTYCPWELRGRSELFPLSLPFSGQARDICSSLRQRKHLPSFMRRVCSSSDSFPVVRIVSTSMVSGSFCFLGGGTFWYPHIQLALVEMCPGPPLGPMLSLRSCHLWTIFLVASYHSSRVAGSISCCHMVRWSLTGRMSWNSLIVPSASGPHPASLIRRLKRVMDVLTLSMFNSILVRQE
jgi:hypothetical protein